MGFYILNRNIPPIGSFDIKNEAYCVRRLDRGFSRIKSDFNNVNLPAYTLVICCPIPSYRPYKATNNHVTRRF